jgi:hypothetical protein
VPRCIQIPVKFELLDDDIVQVVTIEVTHEVRNVAIGMVGEFVLDEVGQRGVGEGVLLGEDDGEDGVRPGNAVQPPATHADWSVLQKKRNS